MFRNFQLKWCFILIAILAVGTMLMRLNNFDWQYLGHYAGHALVLAVYILPCWLIYAYLRLYNPFDLPSEWNSALSIILGVLVTFTLNNIASSTVPEEYLLSERPSRSLYGDYIRRLIASFFLAMIGFIVFNTIFTKDLLQKTKLENEQLKQAHLQAQLISLQQQISPHFLFNSLNTLKSITKEGNTKTYIIQLSRVYRYLLSFRESRVTTLQGELEFLRSYLYILNQRFEKAIDISIDIPEHFLNFLIPPLSLQLLVENAIKHNSFSLDNPLKISIYVDNIGFLVVKNLYAPLNNPAESTKLGIQNIAERFHLIFNEEIRVIHTDLHFQVILPLLKHERNHH